VTSIDGFAERYGPWAVVAGASEGVGASFARELGVRGVNVVLVARRAAALAEVAATVATQARTVVLDLSAPDAADVLAAATADLDVGLLVYNAGADPYMSQLLEQRVEVWQAMLARNCTTVLGAAHSFGGRLVARGTGGIVLVTSGAAWAGAARLATYGATKAFDLLLAESLWAELAPHGIDVVAAILGATDTPALRRLLDGREMQDLADADEVARDVLDHLPDGPTWPPDGSPLSSLARRDCVQLMTQAATRIHGD
jgi:short-subunit dehydrogenase